MNFKRLTAIIAAAALLITGCAGGTGSSAADQQGTSAGEEISGTTDTAEPAGPSSGEGTAAGTASEAPDEEEIEEGEYTKALAKRSQNSEKSDPKITMTDSMPEPHEKSYTVMIYMIGSNLESRLGNATKDLEEIEAAGLNYDDVNVLVYTGGSARWVGNVPCDRNCVLDMSLSGEERIVAGTAGNANMGMPETLASFLTFCDENYPAEHNALILWDHGGGPLWGYGSDELYDSDSLLLDEMRTAMDASPFSGGEEGKKLDLIGFDACLMASMECMSIWQDYANYYVGSEELEPGDGWDYSFLKALEESSDTENLAKSIISRFETYYEGKKSASYNPDLTLSCVDLSRIGNMNEKVNALADRMTDGIDNGDYVTLMRSRSKAKSFGMAMNKTGEVSFYYDLVDVGNLADQMETMYAKEAADVREALQEAVVAQYANIDGAGGMTLYYPCKNKGQFEQLSGYYGDLISKDGYSAFLKSAGDQFIQSKSRDWTLGEPADSGSEYTLQLSEDMLSNMTECTYSVLSYQYAIGLYVPYMEHCKIEPDKNGIIHLGKNVPMAVLRNGDGMSVIRAEEVESDRKRTVYRTKGIMLRSDITYDDHIEDLESAEVTILLGRNKKSGQTEIQNIEMSDSGSGISGGKNSVDLMDWEGLSILAARDCRIPARDGTGRLRPYEEWTKTGATTWSTESVDDEVGFEIMELDQIRNVGNMYCQIEISDMNGEKYASELFRISNPSFETKEVPVGNGTLRYAVYDDHAELIKYNGREDKIEVAEKIDDVPVTVIADSAFSWFSVFDSLGYNPVKEVILPDTVTELGEGVFSDCFELEKVRLPAGLKKIGACAFAQCRSLKEVTMPDTVETIGKCAFACCRSLTEVTIPEGVRSIGTGAFMLCDGITKFAGGMVSPNGAIYSADGKVLLAYPQAAGDSFAVREGTEKIAYGAFAGASAREVTLPEGLTEIGNYAFYCCRNLKAPEFPESLKKVGTHAYDVWKMAIGKDTIPAEKEVISIPASLESIGERAFDRYANVKFEVSGDNRHYAETDGALMNRAGDTIYQLAVNPDGTAFYPEGTVEFTEEPLKAYDSINDDAVRQIYLPESMTKFPDMMSSYKNQERYALYHCPAGSEAEKFAIRMGLQFTNEMEIPEKTLETATEKGTLYWEIYSDHAILYGYSGEDEVVEVPSEADGKPVTAIGNAKEPICTNFSFMYNTGRETPNLVKTVIPEGVLSINENALNDMPVQCEVVLPSTLRRLGKNAISGSCVVSGNPEGLEILEALSVGDYREKPFVLTPGISYIDGEAFSDSQISAFEQSGENAHYSVRDGVLYNADGTALVKYPGAGTAEEFTVPEGVVSIEEEAFSAAMNLKKITLPDSLKEIGRCAFRQCSSLSEIAFGKNTELSLIGESAFVYCDALTEISLPPTEAIDEYAFSSCDALNTVHFAEGTKSIGYGAFRSTLVAAPEFPKTLRKIGDYAFGEYDGEARPGSAKVIHIPAKVNEIGSNAFSSIGSTEFEVDPENLTYSSVDGLLLDKDVNALLICPAGRSGTVTVPDGTTSIMDNAFSNAKGVTDIVIPDSVQYIGSVNFEPLENEDGSVDDEPRYSVTLHCSKGSYAEAFALQRGIPCQTK